MEIDLSLLESGTIDFIDITNSYTIPKEYYENTGILELKDLKVTGKIYRSVLEDDIEELQDYINCDINGLMIIEDSISLEPVEYPFSIEYDDILEENCKKMKIHLIYFNFYGKILYWRSPYDLLRLKISVNFMGMDGN